MDIFDNLDIFEVEKTDYESYFYRLPKTEILKTTPREGLVVYKDIQTREDICGVLTEEVMGTEARRFFIFNFIDESRLGPHKTIQYITMPTEEYELFIKKLGEAAAKAAQETND